MADKGGVMEKQNLRSVDEQESEEKGAAAPRVLNEVETYKVEIINLTQQVMLLKQDLLASQKRALGLQEELLKTQKDSHAKDTEKLLADLGLSGSVSLSKNDDGRYVVGPGK